MSGLCGWHAGGVTGGKAASLIGRMAARLPRLPGDTTRSHVGGAFAVAVTGPANDIDLASDGGVTAAIVGQARWRGDFAEIAARSGNAAALAAAFARLGDGLFGALGGPVALFAVDEEAGRAIAAIDRHGIHRLCYRAGAEGPLVFGTTAASVRAWPGMGSDLYHQALYDYLYFGVAPAPETVFRDQRKLLAGQFLRRQGGRLDTGFYWRLPFAPTRVASEESLAAELREAVKVAVMRTAEGLDPAASGAFLSGGLDSSTVVGMLARNGAAPVNAFSIGFREERFNELPFARIVARHFGVAHHEYIAEPGDVADAVPILARTYDEPFQNSSAVAAYLCARHARAHGVRTLLAGDGGDELFAGNSRYVEQKRYDLYFALPRFLRAALIEPAFSALAFAGSLPVLRNARGYVESARVAMPERLQLYNSFARYRPDEVLDPAIAASVDAHHPVEVMRASYESAGTESRLQRMLALDHQLTLADDDLRKVVWACEAVGVDVRFPLLEDSLAEFAAGVPPELCLKGLQLRYFYKRAFRGFLPDATLDKKKHGFGLPFEVWLGTEPRLRDLVGDSLARLKGRRLFRAEFLDRAFAATGAPGSRGLHSEVAFGLMMLEQWLAAHLDSPAA